ncbi:Aste57867_10260 [Aphanomyces stellatus]|uniref:Aste57867_10260 protein n=1 Tax=Aphanomyces stellatus TaxID=120398 RepID=A0A485KPV9_9STRA|nr:hypothetical protein As57867_010220 [Aphanomyces stellatus]VFT87135.1 Aste57867_10260 [Aphanomyces stellatus]
MESFHVRSFYVFNVEKLFTPQRALNNDNVFYSMVSRNISLTDEDELARLHAGEGRFATYDDYVPLRENRKRERDAYLEKPSFPTWKRPRHENRTPQEQEEYANAIARGINAGDYYPYGSDHASNFDVNLSEFPNDSDFWNNEYDLFQRKSEDQAYEVERKWAFSTNRLRFTINKSDQPDKAHPISLRDLKNEITRLCKEIWGITFKAPGLIGSEVFLEGYPREKHILAWSAAKRGYLALENVTVMMSYGFVAEGSDDTLNQLEYSCPTFCPPVALFAALVSLRAADAIVLSLTRNGDGEGDEQPIVKWPAIACVNKTSNGKYRFRLTLPSHEVAATAYDFVSRFQVMKLRRPLMITTGSTVRVMVVFTCLWAMNCVS